VAEELAWRLWHRRWASLAWLHLSCWLSGYEILQLSGTVSYTALYCKNALLYSVSLDKLNLYIIF